MRIWLCRTIVLKREAHIILSMMTYQGSTRLEPPWDLLALCQRTLGSKRHRYANAGPDKLGAYLMVHGGLNREMDAAAEFGKNPVSKHQIQPEYGDE